MNHILKHDLNTCFDLDVSAVLATGIIVVILFLMYAVNAVVLDVAAFLK